MEHSDLTTAFADATLHRIGSLKAHIAKHGKQDAMKVITIVSPAGFCAIKHRLATNPFKVVTPGPGTLPPFTEWIIMPSPILRAVTFTVKPETIQLPTII